MKVAKSLMNFAWFVLIGFGMGVLSPESRAAETLESSALRIELNTSPYSYRVIEKSSGEVLVSENGGITFTSNGYTVRSASDVTKTSGSMRAVLHLEGTSLPAQVSFRFVHPEVLQVVFAFANGVPAEIKEEFADQGEHYYGIWEMPFGGNIDDRGADHDFMGIRHQADVNYSSARAPFYVSSKKYGVYVETKNQGGGLTAGPFHLVVDCGRPGWSYAVVGYSANLVRSTPGATLSSLGTGRYDVTFPSSVAGCAYLASVGDPGNALVYNPNGVYTGSASNPDAVYIETKNPAGGLSSGIPFHLAVVCPGAVGANFAVVDASGVPARASALTSSYQAGTGSYVMITPVSLSGCTEVATRGSVDASVPYTPGTVEIVPGAGATTIGIQVRDLLYFGGNLDNLSFHAAAVC